MQSNRRFRRGVTAAVLLGGCLATVAGCSSTPASSDKPGSNLVAAPVAPTATPVLTSTATVSLPIENYLLKNSEHAQMLYASKLLVKKCLARYGFDYAVDPAGQQALDPKGDGANMPRRYGIVDANFAARFGYHPSSDLTSRPLPSTPHMSEAEENVFLGDAPRADGSTPKVKEYKGQSVPAHGCAGEAQQKLGTGLQQRLAENINDASFHQSMANARVTAVFKAWSGCMKQHGYQFDTPLDPLKAPISAAPTTAEIEMATSDIACKQKTNLVGVWVAVETAMQNNLIGKNQEALTEMHRTAESTLKNSAKVISEG